MYGIILERRKAVGLGLLCRFFSLSRTSSVNFPCGPSSHNCRLVREKLPKQVLANCQPSQ
ncbi:hypothetical protein BT93_L1824 [Corymbia citriodora subsp. variegata]|uniref:Uncharacterized protein n=1 Tax=Corymbia citriodora subsp. variegata TaxID=360336 RepID=A0A8T0CLM7_CORYI|nr:hypothetical protein BT93_L1824 [Corymbia citriodora subsp. variegata]